MTETPPTTVRQSVDGLAPDVVVVLPYFVDDDLEGASQIAALAGKSLESAIARRDVSGEKYNLTLFHAHDAPPLLVIGAGPLRESDAFQQRRLAATASRYLLGRGYTRICFVDRWPANPYDFSRSVVEGAIFGAYDPALRKAVRAAPRESLGEVLLLSTEDVGELERGAERGKIVGSAVSLARDLVNLPPNEITPSAFAERAKAVADGAGLRCTVLDERALSDIGFGSMLGVASGSQEPARLVVLKHGADDAPVRLALAGKGITFDSGGLSLKTLEGMQHMKGDMGGAAAVVAAILAIAQLGIADISVTAYAGCTENMPSGSAMRPGDVLTAVNDETIEVLNTDAEGRLVLADVLAYAVKEGATHVVDVATLTGGAVVALGHVATLAAGRPMDWVREVVSAAESGLERAWPMPIFEEYRRDMDSEIADIKNSAGRYASALTASAFLGDFAAGAQWAHLDIAGTSWVDQSAPYQQKGGTGAGVGTLVSVAEQLSHSVSRRAK